jgi:hypothetical protein
VIWVFETLYHYAFICVYRSRWSTKLRCSVRVLPASIYKVAFGCNLKIPQCDLQAGRPDKHVPSPACDSFFGALPCEHATYPSTLSPCKLASISKRNYSITLFLLQIDPRPHAYFKRLSCFPYQDGYLSGLHCRNHGI